VGPSDYQMLKENLLKRFRRIKMATVSVVSGVRLRAMRFLNSLVFNNNSTGKEFVIL